MKFHFKTIFISAIFVAVLAVSLGLWPKTIVISSVAGTDARAESLVQAEGSGNLARGLSEAEIRIVLEILKREGIDTEKASQVIFCESSWRVEAVGDNGDSRGLWQINKRFHDVSDECAFDPVCSTEYAVELINKKGWQPWTCGR